MDMTIARREGAEPEVHSCVVSACPILHPGDSVQFSGKDAPSWAEHYWWKVVTAENVSGTLKWIYHFHGPYADKNKAFQ